MAIPIPPGLITNYQTFNTPLVATPMNLCKAPAEGLKCVSLQLSFNGASSYLVDLSKGSPNAPLSQVSCLFVDATESIFDVYIIFLDTGFLVKIGAGDVLLFPVFTGTALPQFYASIGDGNGGSGPVNIFALNQFIPEFANSIYAKNYIYDSLLGVPTLVPQFGRASTSGCNFTQSPYTLSNYLPGFSLKGLQVYADTCSLSGYLVPCTLIIGDGSFNQSIPFTIEPQREAKLIYDTQGANLPTFFNSADTLVATLYAETQFIDTCYFTFNTQ